MSVLDQVRALEQQVLQRLRELRPLVAEYRELEKVAERLGLKRDDDVATAAAPEASEPSRHSQPAAKRRAKPPAGARRSKRAGAGKPKPTATAASKTAAKPKPRSVAGKPKAGAKPKATAAAKAEPKPAATATPAAATPAARGARKKPKPSARKRTAAARGQRERDVLRLVGERPGVTVRDLAAALDVDATGLYGVVRRLEGRGQLSKDGTRLRRPDAPGATGDPNAPGTAAATLDSGPESAPSAAVESSEGAGPSPAGDS